MIESIEPTSQEANQSTAPAQTTQIFGSLYSALPNDSSQDEVNISAAAWSAHRSKILAPQIVRKRDAGQTSIQPLPSIKPLEKQPRKTPGFSNTFTTSPSPVLPVTSQVKSVLSLTSSAEYDPYKPNEYDKIVKERLQKIQNEEMEKKRKKQEAEELERIKKQQELNEEKLKENNIDLKLSGEQAWARRGQISNSSPSNNTPSSSNLSSVNTDVSSSFAAPAASGKKSVAARMMEKMGWRDGEGLGRDKQGMTSILIARKTDRRSGVIVQGSATKGNQPDTNTPPSYASPPAASNFSSSPNQAVQSRVLLLTNLVGPGDIDEDLESEIQEEASKFGNLLEVKIFEQKGLPDDECVRIFCVYESPQQTNKALESMNGRVFGGRLVKARFYAEHSFNNGDLRN